MLSIGRWSLLVAVHIHTRREGGLIVVPAPRLHGESGFIGFSPPLVRESVSRHVTEGQFILLYENECCIISRWAGSATEKWKREARATACAISVRWSSYKSPMRTSTS